MGFDLGVRISIRIMGWVLTSLVEPDIEAGESAGEGRVYNDGRINGQPVLVSPVSKPCVQVLCGCQQARYAGFSLVGVELVASKQTSGSDSTAPDGPERGAAAAPAAASGPDAPLGRAGAASPGKRKKKKWKIQQKILVAVVVPLTAALIGSIGGIIGAEIQKSSSQAPSGSPTTPPPTPAPLGTGQYTIQSSALGYLDVPDPDASGLEEYTCKRLPTETGGSSPNVCIDELDVTNSDLGGGGIHNNLNQVWNIQTSNGVSYTIQSAYDGKVSEGLPPPSCNRFASWTNANGISYGFLAATSTCSMILPSYLSDTFNIIPVAGGYQVRNKDALCLTAINGAGGNDTSTHTRFDECAPSATSIQVWAINAAS